MLSQYLMQIPLIFIAHRMKYWSLFTSPSAFAFIICLLFYFYNIDYFLLSKKKNANEYKEINLKTFLFQKQRYCFFITSAEKFSLKNGIISCRYAIKENEINLKHCPLLNKSIAFSPLDLLKSPPFTEEQSKDNSLSIKRWINTKFKNEEEEKTIQFLKIASRSEVGRRGTELPIGFSRLSSFVDVSFSIQWHLVHQIHLPSIFYPIPLRRVCYSHMSIRSNISCRWAYLLVTLKIRCFFPGLDWKDEKNKNKKKR